ncbi:hypothetical protein Pmani_033429, partial [Petrolisthes manimaculis]
YPPGSDCTTTVLKASPDVTSLVMELLDFEVAASLSCSQDYLEVGGQRLCGQLSGQTRTFAFVGVSMIIRFHSAPGLGSINTGGRGYRIRVGQTRTSIIPPGGCGGFVNSVTASIRSPNYPSNYPPNSDCRYIITKSSSDVCQLHVKILDLDLESSVGCTRDYLQIGSQDRLCGQRYPGEIRRYHFTQHVLNIFFHSDAFGSGRGFSIEIKQVTCGHFKPMRSEVESPGVVESCGDVVTTPTFSFKSPGFPAHYHNNLRCVYTIFRTGVDICGVELVMEQFEVPETQDCKEAHLQLAGRRYCGSIPRGSHSVVHFPSHGPIVAEFQGGRFHSGPGFSLRGRQIQCPSTPAREGGRERKEQQEKELLGRDSDQLERDQQQEEELLGRDSTSILGVGGGVGGEAEWWVDGGWVSGSGSGSGSSSGSGGGGQNDWVGPGGRERQHPNIDKREGDVVV